MTFFHQIFFPNNKFDDPSQLMVLEPYIFKKWIEHKNIPDIPLQQTIQSKPSFVLESEIFNDSKPITNIVISKEIKEIKSWYLPKRTDNLFWCIYIGLYSFKTYERIAHHYGNIEMEEKQKMMEYMKKSPTSVKNGNKKITKILFQEIMSDFMTNKRITMDMLIMYSIYLNKRFLIVNVDKQSLPDRMYMEFGDSSNETFVFYKSGKTDYSIELSQGEELDKKIEEISTTLFRFDNFDLPLKAISNYKLEELNSMSAPLNILWESGKKYKKPDVYAKILETTCTML